MKSIDFSERTHTIAEESELYQIIYTHVVESNDFENAIEHTMCFELDDAEIEQVRTTGRIWLRRIAGKSDYFQPIGATLLKPENFK